MVTTHATPTLLAKSITRAPRTQSLGWSVRGPLEQTMAMDWLIASMRVTGGKFNFSKNYFPLQLASTLQFIFLRETNEILIGRMQISIVQLEFITVEVLRTIIN